MRNKIGLVVLAFMLAGFTEISAQYYENDTYKKCFVGSSLFLLGNLDLEDSPDFAQVNFGYRLTGRDVVSLELITWKYTKSLGISYGESDYEKFPGYIRERGFALAYQRFWWKGLYSGVHVMSAWQSFVNEEGNKIDDGFQIFNTYRAGYHIKLFKGRFFIEPSIAVTHRPYHTDMPESFRRVDKEWSKFFVGEPELHFGFNF